MNACPACGHRNAEHLAYCSECGRRLRPPVAAGNAMAQAGTPAPVPALPTAVSAGLAATVALAGAAPAGGPAFASSTPPTGLAQQGFQSVRYVFATIRGRLDADERRRRLIAERDGALRLSEGTLTEAGQTILAQGITGPRLNDLRETALRLAKRREGILADLAATEKFQAAEDLRLGLLEAAAESESKTSDASVREAEAALKKNEAERREAREALARHDAARLTPTAPLLATEREALEKRRAHLDEHQRTLRERAAALSASMSAAQGRLDQAAATRRQARSAVMASLTGRQRERSENENDLRNVTARIGAQAIEGRLPSPHLQGAYERFDRLAETVRTTEGELARLENLRGGLDQRKLATGLGIIVGLMTVAILVLWRLVR